MDFSNWAVVGFKDDTGIGRMSQDIQKVLGVGKHLVAPSERLQVHPVEPPTEFLLEEELNPEELKKQMEGLEGIFCLERLHWHPALVPTAQALGLKIVCVPMWEWFRGTDSNWKDVDLFICPNLKALEVLKSYGYKNAIHIPWPLDLDALPHRTVTGKAKTFIHNAGLIDQDDRKGTATVVNAFSKVCDPGIRLILRLQKESPVKILDPRVDLRIGNLDDPADLYKEGDVAIQPSWMEGLGFMVLEPVCCGMPVITTNAAPMNEYVRQPQLLACTTLLRKKSFAYRAAAIRHAYLTPPRVSSLAARIDWCSRHELCEVSRENREWAISQHGQPALRQTWEKVLSKRFQNQIVDRGN
jgi:glycosyltransferase involved in cell wall biosynthesis